MSAQGAFEVPNPALGGNSSFSRTTPGLQLAIDSTSLGTFKECPRKYYLRHVLGIVPRETSVHLAFGLLLHKGCEVYDHAKAGGASHREALLTAVRWALAATWDRRLGRPWASGHAEKNRQGLIRALVWHLEKFKDDPCETVILASGKPAVELSFTMPTGLEHKGEAFVLCGHLDKLVRMSGFVYVKDIKTTGSTLTGFFFDRFSPDNQMSLYSIAGRVVYAEPTEGVIVDAIQIGGTFVRSMRGLVPRTAEQSQEWLDELPHWIGQMIYSAETQKWPMNDKACHHYAGCPYRGICSRSPSAREVETRQGYFKELWDPLVRRGDV